MKEWGWLAKTRREASSDKNCGLPLVSLPLLLPLCVCVSHCDFLVRSSRLLGPRPSFHAWPLRPPLLLPINLNCRKLLSQSLSLSYSGFYRSHEPANKKPIPPSHHYISFNKLKVKDTEAGGRMRSDPPESLLVSAISP